MNIEREDFRERPILPLWKRAVAILIVASVATMASSCGGGGDNSKNPETTMGDLPSVPSVSTGDEWNDALTNLGLKFDYFMAKKFPGSIWDYGVEK